MFVWCGVVVVVVIEEKGVVVTRYSSLLRGPKNGNSERIGVDVVVVMRW
jgi:hypothetical protein